MVKGARVPSTSTAPLCLEETFEVKGCSQLSEAPQGCVLRASQFGEHFQHLVLTSVTPC